MVDAGIAGADAGALVTRAFAREALDQRFGRTPIHLVAAGKAASVMAAAFVARCRAPIATAMAVATHQSVPLPPGVSWHASSHPTPDARSVAAARRALEIARAVSPAERLVILLSGGASSLLACPVDGVTLEDKQRTTHTLMTAGADITALNTVRKHLSAIKGGRLAAACPGRTLTLAVSDVVGNDLSVIGSGPGIGDPSTFADALDALDRYAGRSAYPRAVVEVLQAGAAGQWPETPAPGDPALDRATAGLAGGAADAVDAARLCAEALGYHVVIRQAPVIGEAKTAAPAWLDAARRLAADVPRPVCVLSSGETTVRVTGTGRGGRNQEFALALVAALDAEGGALVATSVGTDGIDGPTDAAGAVVDTATATRAVAAGLPPPGDVLAANDSHTFFDGLNDLIRTGPTGTNVGDLQVLLIG